MKTPNLREWQPTESQAKDVMSTDMLSTTAKEPAETVSADNDTSEHVVKHPSFGPLGAQGRR
jgi:hypothetical protein